ncbi:hypothetical protein AB2B38_005945 [Balneola sp. MJW-20]|uniref:hypothetical protein n=1 Tax=Gracilimonas aurantiaca TaxID=3234185 RepID=UPI0034662CFC
MYKSIILSVFVYITVSVSVNAQYGPTKTVEDFVEERVNPCNGENIAFEGTLTSIVKRVGLDENGKGHFMTRSFIDAEGIGDQGNKYEMNHHLNLNLNVKDGSRLVGTNNFIYNVIGKGKAPNFKIKLLVHQVIDINGEVKTNVWKYETTCR